MKKLLILVIVILMLFTGCTTEAPVSPESEAEQPVQTEQPPAEEQPKVEEPETPEEPQEPEIPIPEAPKEPEEPLPEPEEPQESKEPEEPEVIETVSYAEAVQKIAEVLGYEEEAEDYTAYAEQHRLAMFMYDVGWEDPISYRDAAVLLYNAAEYHREQLPMAVVTEESPKIKGVHDDSSRQIMYMYHWGILYGDAPENWFDCIPAEKFDEMLQRASMPEVRMELLPDQLTQLSRKLAKVEHCGCAKTRAWPTAGAAYTMLAEWEGLQRALECSFWIVEYQDGIHYLNMFTGMEDGTVAFTQCSYDASTKQGEISETQTLARYDLSRPETGILYSVCMTDDQKEMFQNELLDDYLQRFRDRTENSSTAFAPYLNGYLAAYVAPWQEDPGLMLVAMDEYMLHSYVFGGGNIGRMAHSWYHIYSMDISTGLDALRDAAKSARVRQKAMSATFCPCMAREYARWRVYGDSEIVPVVRTAFADYMKTHYDNLEKEYGDLLTDAYWLIDRDPEGRYSLQIIGFREESAEQRLVLTYDGSDITVYEGPKTLTGLVYSVCADSCTEDNRKAAEDRYIDRDRYDEQFFWRLSAIEEGECVLTRFGIPRTYGHPSTFARWVEAEYPAWHCGQQLDEELTVTEDRTDGMATMLDQVLAMDFSDLQLGEDEIFLLDYLKVSLINENDLGRWNMPAAICARIEEFVWVRSSIQNFLKELELDPAMKECFAKMDHWTWKDLGDNKYSISGVDSSGRKWEAWMKTVHFVDMEGWVTPSRKHMLELAEAGDNSELIPEEIRDRFVTFALLDSSFSYDLAGKGGSAYWIWSITENGNVRLEVHSVHDEIKKHNKTYQYDTIILEQVDETIIVEEYIYGR